MAQQSQLRQLAQLILPPIITNSIRHTFKSFKPQKELFDGDCQAFAKHVLDAKVYGEYGMGASTQYVAQTRDIPILAVDTSAAWVSLVTQRVNNASQLHAEWIDVGPLGEWGRPKGFSHRERFKNYVVSIWNKSVKPDLVLIDGRFRVACFLSSLLLADADTIIIFDDYVPREHFHVAEEFLKPVGFCGRQAIFRVPENVPREDISRELDRFMYVID